MVQTQEKSVKSSDRLLRYLDTKRATKAAAYSRKINGVSIEMFAVEHMLKQCADLRLYLLDRQGLVHVCFITWHKGES